MTVSVDTIERRKNGHRRSVGMTELVELIIARTPGAELIKDGSNGEIPSDVFKRSYKLPIEIVGEVAREGSEINFIYHLRDGWAQIKVGRGDIKDMDSADMGILIRKIWNTKVGPDITLDTPIGGSNGTH